jgi:type VI secretion system secreted protein Hcp
MSRARRLPLSFVLPTVAALGVGAAVAIGSIPSGSGLITGCYVTTVSAIGGPPSDYPRYGQLRVIDPDASTALPAVQRSCLSDETTVTWHEDGPPGLDGSAGPAGPAGAQGAAGAPGTTTGDGASFGFTGRGRMFMKIDNVKGDSKDPAHLSQFEIADFSFGVDHPTPIGSATAGAGGGKPAFQEFTITPTKDGSTPNVFKNAVAGMHYKMVVIALAPPSGSHRPDYVRFTFGTVFVGKIAFSTGGDDGPTEQITFTYGKLTMQFPAAGVSHPPTVTVTART